MENTPMTGIHLKKRTALLLVAGLVLALSAGLMFFRQGSVQAYTPASPPSAPLLQGADNEACLACHAQPGMTMTLQPSGEVLPLTVDPAAYEASVHGAGGIACTACHADISGYPHPEFTAPSLRDVAISMYGQCQDCHADKYQQAETSVH